MFIGGIIAPILVVFVTIKFLNDKADLRVYESPIISTEFVSSETRNYQQSFTIRNEGNKSAKNIQFSVDGNVVKSKVEKYLAVDEVVEKLNSGDFSLSYPSLNPGSEFIVFLLFDKTVETLPEVSFDEGVATYGAKSNSLDNVIAFSLPIFYILFLISFLRWLYFSSLHFNIDSNFLLKSKSFLITNKEFNNLAEYAIKIVCVSRFRESVADFKSLEIINSLNAKAIHFNDEMSKRLESELNKLFIQEVKYALSQCTNLSELESFYKLEQPRKISDDTWGKFRRELSTRIRKVLPSNYRDSFNDLNRQILVTLEEGMVKGMSKDEFSDHKKILIQALPTILVSRLMVFPILTETVALNEYEIELGYLTEYDKPRVEKLFYTFNLLQEKVFGIVWSFNEDKLKDLLQNKPDWVIDNEWMYIEEAIKKLLKSVEVEKKASELIDTIQKLPDIYVDDNNDHELLNVERFTSYLDRISAIEAEQKGKDKSLRQREINVSKCESEWSLKVDKLQRQLNLIDNILNSSVNVDKIEYPETVFNEGTWRNLIKIESILKDID